MDMTTASLTSISGATTTASESPVVSLLVNALILHAATRSPVSLSIYPSGLSSSSPMFTRPYASEGNYYYYQAIQVTVSASGTYNFTSSSTLDTYGLLYNSPFDPSNPTQNLIKSNDDGGDDKQFLIVVRLESGRRYVFVVSTWFPRETGIFYIKACGPSSVDLTGFTPSSSRPISTTGK